MKIAFFSTSPNFRLNAIFYTFRDALPVFISAGHQVLIQMNPWDDRSEPWLAEPLPGVQIAVRRPFLISDRFAKAMRIANVIYQSVYEQFEPMRKFSPDLFLLNEGKPFEAVANQHLVRYLATSGVPYCVSVHSNSDYVLPSEHQRQTGREFYQNARRIFFYSRHNHQVLERQIGAAIPQHCVISYPQRVKPTSLPWAEGEELRLACVARLAVHDKGQDLLLEALASEELRHRRWKLTFYGQGPDREFLCRLIETYSLSAKVHFAGVVSDLHAVWSANHALVLPSRCEGDSLALTEAIALGRPVVATLVGGSAFWLEDNRTGFLCRDISTEGIKEALVRLFDRQGQLQEIGALAQIHFNTLVQARPQKIYPDEVLGLLDEIRRA